MQVVERKRSQAGLRVRIPVQK